MSPRRYIPKSWRASSWQFVVMYQTHKENIKAIHKLKPRLKQLQTKYKFLKVSFVKLEKYQYEGTHVSNSENFFKVSTPAAKNSFGWLSLKGEDWKGLRWWWSLVTEKEDEEEETFLNDESLNWYIMYATVCLYKMSNGLEKTHASKNSGYLFAFELFFKERNSGWLFQFLNKLMRLRLL